MVAARAIENMKLLRIDEETTANIGIVKGGIATNIVMPELEIVAEARSLSEEKLDAQTNHMVETFKNAAKEFGAEIEIEVKRAYGPFNIDETDEIVQLVKKAFSNMNIEGKTASTGGGSDTNILNKISKLRNRYEKSTYIRRIYSYRRFNKLCSDGRRNNKRSIIYISTSTNRI